MIETAWLSLEGFADKQTDFNFQFDVTKSLGRFFQRESMSISKLYSHVLTDLLDVLSICKGENRGITNLQRNLISALTNGIIPNSWKLYKYPGSWTVGIWLKDFNQRLCQIRAVGKHWKSTNDVQNFKLWIGGLTQPAAWITAIRQTAAQTMQKSMEDLVLTISVGKSASRNSASFPVIDMYVQGAKITGPGSAQDGIPHLDTTIEMTHQLELMYLTWWPKDEKPAVSKDVPTVTLPVYRNSTRLELLFTLEFNVMGSVQQYYERGVALVAAQ